VGFLRLGLKARNSRHSPRPEEIHQRQATNKMNPIHPSIEEFVDDSVGDGELLERRNRGGALGDTVAQPNGITRHSAPPTPPDPSSRRSSDQDRLLNVRVTVSNGGNAGEPVQQQRASAGQSDDRAAAISNSPRRDRAKDRVVGRR
jgi:hypothetical protein